MYKTCYMDTKFLEADIENKDGKITGVASTSVVDRQNESVNVEGWDLKNFKKAPRLLWAHDHTEPAIGKVTKIGFEGEGKKRRMTFEAVFQEVTEKARAIKKLVEDGFINTFSVGFKPLEMEGNEILKQELLEISVVNVPANPDAMLLAYKSLKEDGFTAKTITKVLDDEIIKRFAEQDEKIADLQGQVELAVKGLKHLNPQRSKQEVVATRLSLTKVMVRAADKILEEKSDAPRVSYVKVIKRAGDQLVRLHKEDLNGQTKGTS